MQRFITLLGLWARGDGLVLTLRPRRSLGVGAGTVTGRMAQAGTRLMQRPEVMRLVGAADLGVGCVARCLSRPAAVDSRTAQQLSYAADESERAAMDLMPSRIVGVVE